MSLENRGHLEVGGRVREGCICGWVESAEHMGDEVGHQGGERWERASVYHLKILSQKVMCSCLSFGTTS